MRHARHWRLFFAAYVVLIGVLTHWPGMKIVSPVPRPDLIAHAGVFALWTVLCARSQLFGRWGSWKAIGLTALVSAAYAGLDEWTQRFVNRYSAWDDYLANLLGIALGTAAVAIWIRLGRGRSDSDNTGPS